MDKCTYHAQHIILSPISLKGKGECAEILYIGARPQLVLKKASIQLLASLVF